MSVLRRVVAGAKTALGHIRHNQQEERDLAARHPLPSEHGPTPVVVDESDTR